MNVLKAALPHEYYIIHLFFSSLDKIIKKFWSQAGTQKNSEEPQKKSHFSQGPDPLLGFLYFVILNEQKNTF